MADLWYIKWVDAFNQGDADLIVEFYADHAVNHQIANEPVNGKMAIEKCSSPNLLKQI